LGYPRSVRAEERVLK